jgi:oxaloacetate decarboxylase alpha subunit
VARQEQPVADLQILDVSIRDGNQSLWGATGLTTPQILQIAPVMDRVGYRALDFTSSTHMGVAVRTHREDPWERIRLTRAATRNTPLQFIGSGLRFISWEPLHPDMMQLAYDRLVTAGLSRFVVLDPMHDMAALLRSARMIRLAGGTEIIAALTFTLSDAHDDAYYAGLAGQMAAAPDIDRAYIKDPAGLLTPERARTLIPAVRARLGSKPLELHSHATIGLSPLTYLVAADLGVQVLHVACGALANGTSLPDAQRLVANLRELGHTAGIDDRLLAAVSDYFTALADAESLPPGTPQEYDASFLRHQVAGGVMTTMKRQLAELGLQGRFDQVMDEVSRVRAELGYPIMVTPFPQIVCSQALYNVIGEERYANVSDQLIRYVLGTFGRPAFPVDPEVADRILARPRAAQLRAEPPPASPADLRKRFPAGISGEELLLRATMPADQVDAMLAAGPPARHYNPALKGVLDLLRGLRDAGPRGPGPVGRLVIDKPGFSLELRDGGGPGNAHAG